MSKKPFEYDSISEKTKNNHNFITVLSTKAFFSPLSTELHNAMP